MEQKDKANENVKIVRSYLKMLIISTFSGIIAWKLYTAPWTIDMSKFDFTALLSILLAFFSVGLSVFFYFKATDTSNLFYDNTYKFTKDISEILGRIEAGFGERLRHIDDGYSSLRDKFTNGHDTSPISQNIEKTAKDIEEEKKKLEQQMKEKEEILEKLMTRAKIQEAEKNQILKNINNKDEHIQTLNRELQFLKHKLEKEETIVDRETIYRYPRTLIELMNEIAIEKLGIGLILEDSYELVSNRFRTRIINDLSERGITELRKYGIINREKELTEKGFELLNNIAKREYKNAL